MNDKALREFIDLFPNGVILTDTQTTIRYANEIAHNSFGYHKDELIGLPINTLIPKKLHEKHKEYTNTYAQCPVKMNMSNRTGLLGKRKDDTTFPVDVSLAPIEGKREPFFIAIVRDLTKREYIQKLELKNKQLEQFTRIASHDLQEPLKTILSLTKLLDRQQNDAIDEHTKQVLKYIDQSTNRMSNLIDALLDYSKLNTEKELEKVDCNLIMLEVTQDLRKTIEDTHAIIEYGDLPVILGYQTEFRLLVQNLISNGIKYTQKNTTPHIKVNYLNENQFHVSSFRDNGIGIAEEDQERIFDVFVSLNDKSEYPGTGIGLAHCRKIIEMHDGELTVDSKLGQGSCFTFKIKKT